MATGIGGHAAADLPRFVKDIDFPANRREILHSAQQHHADPQMLERIERIPDREYQSLAEVVEAYGQRH